jgi:hypothetical protein
MPGGGNSKGSGAGSSGAKAAAPVPRKLTLSSGTPAASG